MLEFYFGSVLTLSKYLNMQIINIIIKMYYRVIKN